MKTSRSTHTRSRSSARVGRAAAVSARRSLLDRIEASSLAYALASKPSRVRYSYPSRTLNQVEDSRRWTPDTPPFRNLYTLSGSPAFTVAAASNSRRSTSRVYKPPFAVVSFADPTNTITCVRRHRRREVLFANQRAGFGKSIYTRPRRNWSSSISCRG